MRLGKANDCEEIPKLSLKRIHSKIARDAMEEFSRFGSQSNKMLLPAQISRDSMGIKNLRDLSQPVSTLQRVTGKNLSSSP